MQAAPIGQRGDPHPLGLIALLLDATALPQDSEQGELVIGQKELYLSHPGCQLLIQQPEQIIQPLSGFCRHTDPIIGGKMNLVAFVIDDSGLVVRSADLAEHLGGDPQLCFPHGVAGVRHPQHDVGKAGLPPTST